MGTENFTEPFIKNPKITPAKEEKVIKTVDIKKYQELLFITEESWLGRFVGR